MGTLTVLGLVQEFTQLRGLPTPAAVFGSQEKTVAQYRAILSQVLRVCQSYKWQEQKINTSFMSAASSNQGLFIDIISPGFESLADNTMWNLTRKIPIRGPISEAEWAAQLALELVGPPYKFYVAANTLYLSPAPDAGEEISLTYWTSYSYLGSAGRSPQPTLTADDNYVVFPDDVILKGLESRWKRQKGEPWQDDENEFLDLIAKRKISTGSVSLSLDNYSQGMKPGIYIPIGNWPV